MKKQASLNFKPAGKPIEERPDSINKREDIGDFEIQTRAKIDTSFYQELATRYKAKGDFAMAYVIAHEVGHHVQNELGTMQEYTRARR